MSFAEIVSRAKRVLGMTEEMIVQRVNELESRYVNSLLTVIV